MYSIKVEPEDSPTWQEKRSETVITPRIKQEKFVEETGDNVPPITDSASSCLSVEGSECGINKEDTSNPPHEIGVDGGTWQVNVHLECEEEDVGEITENGIDTVNENDAEDEASCVSRQEEFLNSADQVMDEASAPQTTKSGNRQLKRKMHQSEVFDSSTSHQEARTNAPKKVPAKKTDKTACPENSVAEEGIVQNDMDREKARPAVYQQLALTTMKAEITTLKERVKDLEAKLQMALNRITELETARQKSSVPDLSVVVTPKKLQLVKDVYNIVEAAAGVAPSGAAEARKSLHQQGTPNTNSVIALETTTPPSCSTTEKLVGQTAKTSETQRQEGDKRQRASGKGDDDNKNEPPRKSLKVAVGKKGLTPLYPGGKPILSVKSKCIAFSKDKCKESLLYALLTEVFGNDVLARSNAVGARKAVNKIGTEEHQPLDQDKLHEIKECVLHRYPLKSGRPCMTSTEFNMKINQKCGTARRALKRKLDN